MTAAAMTSVTNSMPPVRSLGVVAAFDSPERLESAVATLQRAGFDLRKLSILAKDAHSGEHLLGYGVIGGRARFWGRLGPTWDRLAQRLSGAALMFLPFIGNIVILGSVVAWLVEDRPGHGAVEGATPLWRLLARLGVSTHDGSAVELALRESEIVLLAAGEPADPDLARDILFNGASRRAAFRAVH